MDSNFFFSQDFGVNLRLSTPRRAVKIFAVSELVGKKQEAAAKELYYKSLWSSSYLQKLFFRTMAKHHQDAVRKTTSLIMRKTLSVRKAAALGPSGKLGNSWSLLFWRVMQASSIASLVYYSLLHILFSIFFIGAFTPLLVSKAKRSRRVQHPTSFLPSS